MPAFRSRCLHLTDTNTAPLMLELHDQFPRPVPPPGYHLCLTVVVAITVSVTLPTVSVTVTTTNPLGLIGIMVKPGTVEVVVEDCCEAWLVC